MLKSIGLLALLLLLADVPVRATATSDIHGMQVGMFVDELSDDITRFSCAADPARTSVARTDWKSCSPGPDGLRALDAMSGAPDAYQTRIVGHPVRLEVFLDAHGRVAKMIIETDPNARPRDHARAYLLGQQTRSHYGQDHWICTSAKPASDEEPVGPTYVKEQCSKRLEDRDIVMERSLLRKRSAPHDAVNQTRIVVVWIGEAI